MIRAKWVAALAAAAGVLGLAASANAGPVSSAAMKDALSTTSGAAEQVHYRGDRHCHWRGGVRRCHGGYGHRYEGRRYGSGPSIRLYFGSRDYDRRRRWR